MANKGAKYFENAFARLMEQIEEEVRSESEKDIADSAKTAVTTINKVAPHKTGYYRNSWRVKMTVAGKHTTARIWSPKRYMLTHLLEKGHWNVRTNSFTKGIPHIVTGFNEACKKLSQKMNIRIG